METLGFWAVAGAMTVIVAAFLVRSLAQGRAVAEPAAAQDIRVYRDQLAEADRDLARGTLTEAEAQRLKTEIARRLLEADRALQAGAPVAATPRAIWPAMAAVAVASLGGLALYAQIGLPWYPDLPIRTRMAEADAAMAARPSQAAAVAGVEPLPPPQVDPEFAALMDKLRAAIDPATATDPRGLDLLARNEAALGNLAGPVHAIDGGLGDDVDVGLLSVGEREARGVEADGAAIGLGRLDEEVDLDVVEELSGDTEGGCGGESRAGDGAGLDLA